MAQFVQISRIGDPEVLRFVDQRRGHVSPVTDRVFPFHKMVEAHL